MTVFSKGTSYKNHHECFFINAAGPISTHSKPISIASHSDLMWSKTRTRIRERLLSNNNPSSFFPARRKIHCAFPRPAYLFNQRCFSSPIFCILQVTSDLHFIAFEHLRNSSSLYLKTFTISNLFSEIAHFQNLSYYLNGTSSKYPNYSGGLIKICGTSNSSRRFSSSRETTPESSSSVVPEMDAAKVENDLTLGSFKKIARLLIFGLQREESETDDIKGQTFSEDSENDFGADSNVQSCVPKETTESLKTSLFSDEIQMISDTKPQSQSAKNVDLDNVDQLLETSRELALYLRADEKDQVIKGAMVKLEHLFREANDPRIRRRTICLISKHLSSQRNEVSPIIRFLTYAYIGPPYISVRAWPHYSALVSVLQTWEKSGEPLDKLVHLTDAFIQQFVKPYQKTLCRVPFHVMLESCVVRRDWEGFEKVWIKMTHDYELKPSSRTVFVVVRLFLRFDQPILALKTLLKQSQVSRTPWKPDVSHFTPIIKYYSEREQMLAVTCASYMRKCGIDLNLRTYTHLIRFLVRQKRFPEAIRLVKQLQESEIPIDFHAGAACIEACSKIGDLDLAFTVYRKVSTFQRNPPRRAQVFPLGSKNFIEKHSDVIVAGLLYTCANARNPSRAFIIYDGLMATNQNIGIRVYSALTSVCLRCTVNVESMKNVEHQISIHEKSGYEISDTLKVKVKKLRRKISMLEAKEASSSSPSTNSWFPLHRPPPN